jgi:hypothetical protein
MASHPNLIKQWPPAFGNLVELSGFKAAALDICSRIKSLQEGIAAAEHALRGETIGSPDKKYENGRHFERQILPFIHGLHKLKEEFSPDIVATAGTITKLAKNSPQAPREWLDSLWLSWVLAFEPLGLRASKRFSAAVINVNHELVAWSVVRPYPGLRLEPHFFIKGEDGGRAWRMQCAERAATADALGYTALDRDVAGDRKILQAYMTLYNSGLREKAETSRKLKTYTLIAGHFPCSPCATFLTKDEGREFLFNRLVTQGVTEKNRILTSPTRNMNESYGLFMKNNLPVSIVSPALNVFSIK